MTVQRQNGGANGCAQTSWFDNSNLLRAQSSKQTISKLQCVGWELLLWSSEVVNNYANEADSSVHHTEMEPFHDWNCLNGWI